MPPRQRSLTKGRWRAIALSLLLHGAIIAGAVFSWFTWKHRAPEVATLAIEASVVDASTLKGAPPTPAPEPPPPEPVPEPAPAEEQGPPKPDPAEIERKQEEARLAAEKVEQEKLEQAKKDEQQLKERQDAERLETEKKAAAKAAAEKTAAEKAVADKKAADKKRIDDAAAAKKAADEKARVTREAELRRSMEAEEHGNAVRNSDEAARWHAAIVARITRAWTKPPSAQPGISCTVSVTQVPGGEVTAVHVDSCNGGDAALKESVERAVYNASPLPPPPDPALFERNLILTFEPQN